jgi:hypothetical protein
MRHPDTNRHVVLTGNRVLGERFCQGCRRHHKVAAFDDDGAQCKASKERRRKAHAAISKRSAVA